MRAVSSSPAASASFVSQSTLSTGLKELESTLGVQLVERDRQTVALTPIGKEVANRARHLIAAADDLVAFVADTAQPLTGTLRLGVIPTIAPFFLPTALPVLRERFPSLKFALREDLTQNLLDRLNARQLDFALIALPYPLAGLHSRVLFEDAFWQVAREGDPILKAPLSDPGWMEGLLLLEEGHCLREHALQACHRHEAPNPEGLEATSLLTLLHMVEAGLGIALLPHIAIQAGLLKNTHLSARPLPEPAPRRGIALVTRSTSPHQAEFAAIAEVLGLVSPTGIEPVSSA